MSRTAKERSDHAKERSGFADVSLFGNTQKVWTRATPSEISAEEATFILYALLYYGRRDGGAIVFDWAERFAQQVSGQAGAERFEVSAWSGEWEMVAEAVFQLRAAGQIKAADAKRWSRRFTALAKVALASERAQALVVGPIVEDRTHVHP